MKLRTKFVTLIQNNSGGYYILNEDVQHYVIIEVLDFWQFEYKANNILENYRAYCECCGDRWDDDIIRIDDMTDEPMIYDVNAFEFRSKGEKAIIYYLNGKKEIIDLTDGKVEGDEDTMKLWEASLRLCQDKNDEWVTTFEIETNGKEYRFSNGQYFEVENPWFGVPSTPTVKHIAGAYVVSCGYEHCPNSANSMFIEQGMRQLLKDYLEGLYNQQIKSFNSKMKALGLEVEETIEKQGIKQELLEDVAKFHVQFKGEQIAEYEVHSKK